MRSVFNFNFLFCFRVLKFFISYQHTIFVSHLDGDCIKQNNGQSGILNTMFNFFFCSLELYVFVE